MTTPERYHPSMVLLHWLLAVMVIVALFMGSFVLASTPNSDAHKIVALRMHMIAGGLIGALMLLRLVLRHTTARPAPAVTGIAWADRLAGIVHWGLYLLVLAMAGSGIAIALQAGLPDIVFNGAGPLPQDFSHIAARGVHGLVAGVLTVFVLAHIGAALWHQFVRKDRLLSRMALPCGNKCCGGRCGKKAE